MSLYQTVRTKLSHLYRDINEFKSYQLKSNFVKDENSDLLADSHNTTNRWKNYFSQLLNVHGLNNVKQTDMHTAKPLVPKHSPFEAEIVIEKLKIYKLPGINQILAELTQAGSNTLQDPQY
jgi:hypothetical protein